MKSHIKFGFAILLAASAAAHADVTLLTPEEIPVLALDDQEISLNFLRGRETAYKLDPGQHNVSVRYEQLFEHTNGDHDILKSGVVTIPANFENGKTYKLKLVNPPKNFEIAQTYVTKPTIAVVDDAGRIIAQQTGVDNTAKPWLAGGLFGRVFDLRNSDSQQIAKNLEAQKKAQAANAVPVIAAPVNIVSTQGSAATLDQLKQLWQQATPAERQQFASWIFSNK